MSNIREPNFADVNLYRLTYGVPLSPKKMIESFDDEVYEDFIACWLIGYVQKKYSFITRKYEEIENIGGAGDKGRDVIAYVTDQKAEGEWDNYQCKKYEKSLSPTMIYKEIGKLLYYTYIEDYTIPRKYYFVAPKDVGGKLRDMLNKPDQLKKAVIENWDSHCKTQITKTKVISLEGTFKEYVDDFDFAIFDSIGTHRILEEFEKTKYYTTFFGGGFKKPRPLDKKPSSDISEIEKRYVLCLLEAYEDHYNQKISSVKDLHSLPEELDHFQRQRVAFYKAESLRDYANESLPTDEIYNDFKECIYDAIIDTVKDDHCDGYKCLRETLKEVVKVDLSSNILYQVAKPGDRKGICHQLVNDGKLRWVKNNGK